MKWLTLTNVKELPDQWDELAGENIFLKKCFLEHLEKVNYCGQTYNLLLKDNQLQAAYVDYLLRLDVFTFSVISWNIPVRIMGIPCSVSKQGFSVRSGFEKLLVEHFRRKKGAKLILNSTTNLPAKRGETLPSCKMEVCWNNFNQYLKSLRSSYRYRVKKAQEKWQQVRIELIKPEDFDLSCYRLYEEVFNRSEEKLEKLNIDFFRAFPLPSVIIKASFNEKILGFIQLVENGSELIFLFIGFDHKLNRSFDIYNNLLLEIIKFAIDKGYKVIDLGQTAEETKLKLGSKLLRKGMYISHSMDWLDKLANRNINLLSYKVPAYDFHVFKEEGDK